MTDMYAQWAEEDAQIIQMLSDLASRYAYSFTKMEAACNVLVSRYPFSLLFIVSLCWLGHAPLCTELESILTTLVSVEDRQAYQQLMLYMQVLR